MADELSLKIQENERRFFQSKFWDTSYVRTMLFDIIFYLKDKEFAVKVVSKVSPEFLFALGNGELISWIESTLDLFNWKALIEAWKSSLLESLISYLKEVTDDIDSHIARYLYVEASTILKR